MKIIIGILGEKLAGKDTAAHYLVDHYGAVHIKTSQILDDLLNVLGLPITRHNEIEAGRGMEAVFGAHIIGETVLKRVEQAKADLIVVNGLRFKDQFEDVRNLGAKVIYITAPVQLRYERTLSRHLENKDGHAPLEEFIAQEQGWTEVNIPMLGAQADYKIENSGTLEELYGKIDGILNSLIQNSKIKT